MVDFGGTRSLAGKHFFENLMSFSKFLSLNPTENESNLSAMILRVPFNLIRFLNVNVNSLYRTTSFKLFLKILICFQLRFSAYSRLKKINK